MKYICKKNRCTGCGLCADKCPIHCISMQAIDNKLGHIYPVINQSQCIDCGICKKMCPTNYPLEKCEPITAYAGWDKNIEEYKSTTSGGAASAMGRYIVRRGGVVYGCVMLPGIKVKHIRITSGADLCNLKGSKYVQSDTSNAYNEALEDLKKGRTVLFIGTPCQIAAIKKLAGKNGKNLFTVDLICHGVPSLKYLKNHCSKKIGDIHNVIARFRGLDGMQLTLLKINYDGTYREVYKSILWSDRYKDTYLNAFFDGYTYRESCRTCQYACKQRISDITIGDFWGLGKKIPFKYDYPYGCSVLLPSTNKGLELINGIESEFNLYERTVEEAINGNDQLRFPFKLTNHIRIFNLINTCIGIDKAYKICVIDKMIVRKCYRIRCKLSLMYKKLRYK